MRRSPLRALLPALLAACLFFCGCGALFPQAPVSAPASPAATPQPTPAPTPTPRVGNPVWLFYQDFYGAAQELLDGLHAVLAESEALEALEGELLLCALEARLTEGMVSFGLLMSADTEASSLSGNYASSVDGAAPGSGAIAYGGSVAALSFQYTDGTQLTGSLSPYRLRYSRQAPEAEAPAYTLLLLRSPKGWAARLETGAGDVSVLQCDGSVLGLYLLSEGAQEEPSLITYETCAQGALRGWIWDGEALAIQ